MVLWKFSLRAMRSRPGRAALTLLSIVIGVAIVVSVSIGTQTTRAAYKEMFATISGRAALEVRSDGGGAYDQSVLTLVQSTPGVKTAVPVLQQYTVLRAHGKPLKLLALGVDPVLDKSIRDYRIVAGSDLSETSEGVVIAADLARGMKVEVGDEVKITVGARGVARVPVIGISSGDSGLTGMAYLRLAQLQELFGLDGQVTSIQVVLEPEAKREAVQAEIAGKLPVGLTVRPPATGSDFASETMEATEQGLRLTAGFSLLLATFIILNTFLMNVGERRRQLSIMRAVGATRGQIAWMMCRESLVMAVMGVAVGIVLGLGGAYLLIRSLDQVLQVSLPSMIVSPWTLFLATGLGLFVAVLGSAVPAYRASRLSPLEGMGMVSREDLEGTSKYSIVAGLITTALSGAVLAGCIVGWLPVDIAVVTAIFLLVGVVLMSPLLLGGLSRVAVWLVGWMARVEAHLAHRQVLRHRARSTLTVGVLFVASAAGVGMAGTILDNMANLRGWSRKVIAGDFFVRAMMPDMRDGLSGAIPDAMGDEIRAIPGVAHVSTGRAVAVEAAGKSVIVIAREFPPGEPLYLDLVAGDRNRIRDELTEGQVVIGTVLAQRAGLKLGDELEMKTALGTRKLRIAGLANEYLSGGLVVYMERRVAEHLLRIQGVDGFIIRVEPGTEDQVRGQLEPLCEKWGVFLHSASDITGYVDNMSNGVNGCLWGIVVLGFVVAAFGTVNTLTMNVLEQTRELGLLRIVAMTRWQVRKAILTQAAIIAMIGLVPGALSGIIVAWLINLATMPATGHPIEFALHPVVVVGCLGAGMMIVLVSAFIPAERAARLELTTALQYE